jgi:DNA-binding NarL/FixJ family response regulator
MTVTPEGEPERQDSSRDPDPDNSPESIVFIDPKALTRQAVSEMLVNAFPNRKVTGVSTCKELRDGRNETRVIIIHIRSMLVRDVWVRDELQAIRDSFENIPIIAISDREDSHEIFTALSSGIRGYIPTSMTAEMTFAVISLVEAGGTFIPERALRSYGAALDDTAVGLRQSNEFNLTSRELLVLNRLREGKANKVIAMELKMQESTVKVHVRNILKKLRVTNRTQAVTVANQHLGDILDVMQMHELR